MKDDKNAAISELKWGSILSYSQMFLSIAVGVTYTPVMIRILGQSEYGLYSTVSSTISLLSILSLGFNSSYIRYYARYRKEKDCIRIYRLNGLFLIIFSVIGLIALACGLFLTGHLDLVFDTGLTATEFEKAKVLMFLLSIDLALSFPLSVFSTIISANEKFVFLKLMGMLNTVLSPMVNLPLLLMGYRSIALVVSAMMFNALTGFINIYYVLAQLNNKFQFDNLDKKLFRNLFIFTAFIAINLIVDQINNVLDKVLLGRYKGTSVVAVYAVGSSLYKYFILLSTAISGVFTPRIHHLYNSFDDEQSRSDALSNLFIKVGRIQFLILMLVASGLILFGQRFICLWVGQGYEESYYVALLLILPTMIPLIQNIGIEIQRAANKHQFRSIVYGLMALCNLAITIVLCQRYGAVGAAFGTSVSIFLANGILMNIYYRSKIGLDIKRFWKNIFHMLAGIIPALSFGVVIRLKGTIDNLVEFLIYVALYTVVYCASCWSFSMNTEEKNLVKGFFIK